MDTVAPARPACRAVMRPLEAHGVLACDEVIQGHVALAIDGTRRFGSTRVRCDSCLTWQRRSGEDDHHPAMVAGCLVHPELSQVLAIAPEAIAKQHGATQNDCEGRAGPRLLTHYREDDPTRKTIVLGDSRNATTPL